jgi:hypothetical protein
MKSKARKDVAKGPATETPTKHEVAPPQDLQSQAYTPCFAH